MTFFKLTALTAPILFASTLLTGAANGQSPPPARPASGASASAGAPGGATAQALNAAQLATVKTTLAPYKPGSLTADDAKLIKRTLRDAGLPRSPALDAVLAAAGFSPAKLDQLDPPPLRPADGNAPPPQKK